MRTLDSFPGREPGTWRHPVMRTARRVVALVALAAIGVPAIGHAVTTYAIKGKVIANGGNWGANATQMSNGTAGQSIAGWSSKLYFSLCSGFWCFGGARVVGVDDGGGGDSGGTPVPKELTFGAPSPNPSRGVVSFALGLPRDATVRFSVFDVAGRQIGETVTRTLPAGTHQLRWSAPADHSGVYFGLLRVDGAVKGERRIVLVR